MPANGAALLAKATHPEVDALSIKEGYSKTAFSLRSVGHLVLVPASRDEDRPFDLLVRGREPLSNQLFFRYDHWTLIERIEAGARPFYDEAIAHLNELNRLPREEAQRQALLALAAFLRNRLAAAASVLPKLTGAGFTIELAAAASEAFLQSGDDRPLRAQALVAGYYDLAFGREHVDSRGLYDPSRHGPGDVRVRADEVLLIAAEVRAKPVTLADAQGFVDACGRAAVSRAQAVALAQREALDRDQLFGRGARRSVLVGVVESVAELMMILMTTPESTDVLIQDLPVRVAGRLLVLEASQATIDEWADRCRME